MKFYDTSLPSPIQVDSPSWLIQGLRDPVILVVRECIWNVLVVLLGFPTFVDTGSLGYLPHWMSYHPCGSTLVSASFSFRTGNREAELKHAISLYFYFPSPPPQLYSSFGAPCWGYSLIITYIYILFIRHLPYLPTARNNAKKRDRKERTKKKRILMEGKTIHPNAGNWCAHGGRRREQINGTKMNKIGAQNSMFQM